MAKEPEAGSPSWNSVTFQGNRVPCIHPFDSFSAESAERTIQGNKNWCRYLTNPNRYTLWHHLGEIQQNYHIHLRSYKHCLIPPTKKKHFHHPAAFQKRQGSSQHFSLQRFCQLPQFCHAASTWRGSPVEGKKPGPGGGRHFSVGFANEKKHLRKLMIFVDTLPKQGSILPAQLEGPGWKLFLCFFFKASYCSKRSCFPKSQPNKTRSTSNWLRMMIWRTLRMAQT